MEEECALLGVTHHSLFRKRKLNKLYTFMLYTNIPIKPKASLNRGSQSHLANIESFIYDFSIGSQFGWFQSIFVFPFTTVKTRLVKWLRYYYYEFTSQSMWARGVVTQVLSLEWKKEKLVSMRIMENENVFECKWIFVINCW